MPPRGGVVQRCRAPARRGRGRPEGRSDGDCAVGRGRKRRTGPRGYASRVTAHRRHSVRVGAHVSRDAPRGPGGPGNLQSRRCGTRDGAVHGHVERGGGAGADRPRGGAGRGCGDGRARLAGAGPGPPSGPVRSRAAGARACRRGADAAGAAGHDRSAAGGGGGGRAPLSGGRHCGEDDHGRPPDHGAGHCRPGGAQRAPAGRPAPGPDGSRAGKNFAGRSAGDRGAHDGVCAGHAGAEDPAGGGAPVARSRGGDDGRRGERRAGAEAGRHRGGDGDRWHGGGAECGGHGAGRRQFCEYRGGGGGRARRV